MRKDIAIKLLARLSAVGLIIAYFVYGQAWMCHEFYDLNGPSRDAWYRVATAIVLELSLIGSTVTAVVGFIIWEKT